MAHGGRDYLNPQRLKHLVSELVQLLEDGCDEDIEGIIL
jgi:hypothetical protein